MKRNAFTLLELLIILSILGILVVSVVLRLQNIPEAAEARAMLLEKDQIQDAIDIYNSQHVIAGSETRISALSGTLAVRISPVAQPSFGRYVRRQTKYYYTWDENGAALTVFKYEDKSGPSQ